MTNIAAEIQMLANELVTDRQQPASKLKKELFDIETRKVAIEAQLNSIHAATKRLGDFRAVLGADYQCPCCYIKNETRSTIRPIPGEPNYDFFRCETCKEVFRFLAL